MTYLFKRLLLQNNLLYSLSMKIDSDLLDVKYNDVKPEPGKLLIAEPFLKEPSFTRSVILLVSHSVESSMGIVLNNPMPLFLNEVKREFEYLPEIPLFKGGPLGENILFFIHTYKDIPNALPIAKGLYLNGDFEVMQKYILQGKVDLQQIRFFLGYTGWGPHQLDFELTTDTWLIVEKDSEYLLNSSPYTLWNDTLSKMGDKFKLWSRFPIEPSNN